MQKYLPYDDPGLLANYFEIHNQLGTIYYALDGDEVIGLVRFNTDGETGEILDLVIRPDWRNKGLGNHFIRRALKSFPNGKWLVFKRGRKARSEERKILISDFLKHEKF